MYGRGYDNQKCKDFINKDNKIYTFVIRIILLKFSVQQLL